MRTLLAITLIWVASLAQAADQKYLCIADAATGFKYRETSKRWTSANFNVDAVKYIISKPKPGFADVFKLSVTQIGDDFPLFNCEKGFNDSGFLYCEGFMGSSFSMNSKNLRFTSTFTGMYVHVGMEIGGRKITDSNADDSMVEIGKCSPL